MYLYKHLSRQTHVTQSRADPKTVFYDIGYQACLWMRLWERVFVCICVYVCVYLYVCACACVCVCVLQARAAETQTR